MGEYQGIIDRINRRCEDLPYIEKEHTVQWRAAAEEVGVLGELDDDLIDFVTMWPEELVTMVASLMTTAAASRARLRFAWVPGYDFSVSVAKSNADPDAQPEYTVLLQSRYPHEIKRSR